jgi:hypothetical protein
MCLEMMSLMLCMIAVTWILGDTVASDPLLRYHVDPNVVPSTDEYQNMKSVNPCGHRSLEVHQVHANLYFGAGNCNQNTGGISDMFSTLHQRHWKEDRLNNKRTQDSSGS